MRGPVVQFGAMDVTLREIGEANREAVLALSVAPAQERFVGSVLGALELAVDIPEAKPWYRAVYAAERPVGFVMVSWGVEPRPEDDIFGPWFLWKLIIDKRYQGEGFGREVVRQVAEIVRAAGAVELLTSYMPGEGDPGGFYRRLGFVPTGECDSDGEPILRLALG